MSLFANSDPVAAQSPPRALACEECQAQFSAYLDGAISGREMAALDAHLRLCCACATEFAAWRSMEAALAELGPARAPENLQSRLRTLLAAERQLGAHLSPHRRFLQFWAESLAPMALRTAGGLAIALALLGGLGWMFGPGLAVQANDDRMTHLIAPRYLYSQVPSQPISSVREVPIVVDAQVDERGRVYDYTVLVGPQDPTVALEIEADLLASVFKPASLFGEPVRGHVVMTFTGVSVHP